MRKFLIGNLCSSKRSLWTLFPGPRPQIVLSSWAHRGSFSLVLGNKPSNTYISSPAGSGWVSWKCLNWPLLGRQVFPSRRSSQDYQLCSSEPVFLSFSVRFLFGGWGWVGRGWHAAASCSDVLIPERMLLHAVHTIQSPCAAPARFRPELLRLRWHPKLEPQLGRWELQLHCFVLSFCLINLCIYIRSNHLHFLQAVSARLKI